MHSIPRRRLPVNGDGAVYLQIGELSVRLLVSSIIDLSREREGAVIAPSAGRLVMGGALIGS